MAIITPDSQTAMGGYDYQFVEVPSPDWLMCNIYHYPSKKPRLSLCCGNVFCKSCLDGAKQVTVPSVAQYVKLKDLKQSSTSKQ